MRIYPLTPKHKQRLEILQKDSSLKPEYRTTINEILSRGTYTTIQLYMLRNFIDKK